MRKRRSSSFESRTDEKFSRSGPRGSWNTSEIIVFHRKLKWLHEQGEREEGGGRGEGRDRISNPVSWKYMRRRFIIVYLDRLNVNLYIYIYYLYNKGVIMHSFVGGKLFIGYISLLKIKSLIPKVYTCVHYNSKMAFPQNLFPY